MFKWALPSKHPKSNRSNPGCSSISARDAQKHACLGPPSFSLAARLRKNDSGCANHILRGARHSWPLSDKETHSFAQYLYVQTPAPTIRANLEGSFQNLNYHYFSRSEFAFRPASGNSSSPQNSPKHLFSQPSVCYITCLILTTTFIPP